jgi:hypothetical protein
VPVSALRAYLRFSFGTTNFNAVWVGLKLATLISVSPALKPLDRTSDSVIAVCPLG